MRTAGNNDVANFTVAADTRNKDKEGKKITNFYRVTVWGKPANVCMQYLHKGDKVYVEGELSARTYVTNGETKISLDVNATDVKFLSERSENNAAPAQGKANSSHNASDNSDELPF